MYVRSTSATTFNFSHVISFSELRLFLYTASLYVAFQLQKSHITMRYKTECSVYQKRNIWRVTDKEFDFNEAYLSRAATQVM
jgi:hypothetical protein